MASTCEGQRAGDVWLCIVTAPPNRHTIGPASLRCKHLLANIEHGGHGVDWQRAQTTNEALAIDGAHRARPVTRSRMAASSESRFPIVGSSRTRWTSPRVIT